MIDLNNVTVIGNLTRDPELKNTNNGNQVCNFSIANNQDYGESKKVNYFDVQTWGKLATVCNSYLNKGSKICVSGKLSQNRWEHEGKSMSKIIIVAESIQFLSKNDNKPDNEPTQPNEYNISSDENMPF